MALLFNFIHEINEFLDKHGDPRTEKWALMSSPFYTIGIIFTYLYVVKILGPKLMEKRKPFQLKNTLLIYNFVQVVISTYLFYEIGMSGWLTGEYNYHCQPVDYSNKPEAIRMLNVARAYYLSKFTEFLDTIFFVMRKKYDQITVLHLIHHSTMPLCSWFGVKLVAGGHGTFFIMLNSFVHIVMYGYYFLSALGPKMQKYLWWKKYLTALQIVQFIAVVVHTFQLLFIECNYPRVFVWVIGLHAVLFFFLFKNFYNKAYKEKDSKKIN